MKSAAVGASMIPFVNAETTLTKALSLDPENAANNANMASVKVKLGKAREALPFAQKAVDALGAAAAQKAADDAAKMIVGD